MKTHVYKLVKCVPQVAEMDKAAPLVYKSWSPCHGGSLLYRAREMTRMLPGSVGIFVFKGYDDALEFDKCLNGKSKIILLCEAEGSLIRINRRLVGYSPVDAVIGSYREKAIEALYNCREDIAPTFRFGLDEKIVDIYTVEAVTPVAVVVPL